MVAKPTTLLPTTPNSLQTLPLSLVPDKRLPTVRVELVLVHPRHSTTKSNRLAKLPELKERGPLATWRVKIGNPAHLRGRPRRVLVMPSKVVK